MAVGVRTWNSSSSATAANSWTLSLSTGWNAAGVPTTGDLIVFTVMMAGLASAGTFSQSAGTGTWTTQFDQVNTGVNAFGCAVFTRILQAGDTDPTFHSSGTAAKWSWAAVCMKPGAGETIAVDVTPASASQTTGVTSFTPPQLTAASASVASVLSCATRKTATGTTAISVTQPTGWTGDSQSSTSAGTTAALAQVDCEVAHQLSLSGTVTPTACTSSVSVTAQSYHFLVSSAAAAASPVNTVIQGVPQAAPAAAPSSRVITGAASALTGTAVLSGAGTLAAGPAFTAAVTLAGSGTLTAAPVFRGTAALSGSGTLAAAAAFTATATLSGSGTVTAGPAFAATATLSGAGTLTGSAAATGASIPLVIRGFTQPLPPRGPPSQVIVPAGSGYDAAVLADKPVFYLAAAAADASGHGHAVTSHGAVPATAALPNGDAGWVLDGSTQWLSVADADDLSVVTTGALTIEIWHAPSAVNMPGAVVPTGYVNFFGKAGFWSPPGSNQYEYELRYFNQNTTDSGNVGESLCGYAFPSLAGGLGTGFDDAAGVTVGKWIHTAVVYDCTSSPSRVTIYRNGAQANTTTFTGTPQNGTNPLTIGSCETDESDQSFWYGWLGKAAVYPTVLSSARVLAHFQAMTGGGGAAALSGSGTLTASPVFAPAAALSGSGTLTASPAFAATAVLSGSGTLTGAYTPLVPGVPSQIMTAQAVPQPPPPPLPQIILAGSSGAQASVRSSSTYGSAGTEASFSMPLPSGWQPGDVCYIWAELRAATGALGAAPTGWSTVIASFHSGSSTSSEAALYRRVLQAGDTDPVTVTGTSGRFGAVAVAVQNADTTTPEDGAAPVTNDNGPSSISTCTASSITPISSNDLLLCLFGAGTGTSGHTATFGAPSPAMATLTQASSSSGTATNAAAAIASVALSSASATSSEVSAVTESGGLNVAAQAATIVVRSATTGGTPVAQLLQVAPPGPPPPAGALSQVLVFTPVAGLFAGAATLTGLGTLTAGPAFTATATLAGSGTLTASPALAGQATFSGAGTLTASPALAAAAVLAGSGTLTAAPVFAAAATLSGTGTLSAVTGISGPPLVIQAVPQPPTPPRAPPPRVITGPAAALQPGAATLSGAGTLGATPYETVPGALSGAGTLTAAPVLAPAGALTGSGTLAAAPTFAAAAALSGAGTLTGRWALALTAVLSGAGALTAAATTGLGAAATLSGAGTLAAVIAPPFTVGALTATTAPGAALTASAAPTGVLTATTATAVLTARTAAAGATTAAAYPATYAATYAGTPGSTLTATDTRTGGPG